MIIKRRHVNNKIQKAEKEDDLETKSLVYSMSERLEAMAREVKAKSEALRREVRGEGQPGRQR